MKDNMIILNTISFGVFFNTHTKRIRCPRRG